MTKSKSRLKNVREVIRLFSTYLLILVNAGCVATNSPSDDLSVPVAFEINGAFLVSMKLPQAKTENLSGSANFVVVEKSNSQQLFRAMYDPGRGKNRGILLTRVWATVHRYSEPGWSEPDGKFEREKTLFKENGSDTSGNYSFDGVEVIGNRDWLSVKSKGNIGSGFAFATALNEEYALIVGVRVFGKDDSAAEIRNRRLETLRQVVESVTVEAL